MIGGFPLGARPVGAFRLILTTATITFAVVVAGGGAASAGVAKWGGFVVAADGGGSAVAGLAKAAAFGAAAAGGGAVQLGLVKSVAFSVAPAGGGSVVVGFAALSTNLFAVPLPGSRVIDSSAVPGIAARPVQTVMIKPVGTLR